MFVEMDHLTYRMVMRETLLDNVDTPRFKPLPLKQTMVTYLFGSFFIR